MMDNPLEDDLNHILAHTKGLWEGLRGKRLFITGGTGFVGCWLLESFVCANDSLGLGAEALVLTRDPDAFRRKAPHLSGHPAVKLVHGEVCSFPFPAQRCDSIIHAAAETSPEVERQDPLKTFQTILVGTQRVLDYAPECGASRFLFISSGAVYGKQPPEMAHIPEDYQGVPDPTDIHLGYGEGKRAAELLCALYTKRHKLKIKIARCFAFVGPYLPLDAHFAIGNFIRDAMRGGPIQVKGDGTPHRSYLYAADMTIGLWTILLRGGCSPYNVGSEESLTIAELAHLVAQNFRPPVAVEFGQSVTTRQNAERYVPCIDRARTTLGLGQRISLEEAIRRTAAWYSQRSYR